MAVAFSSFYLVLCVTFIALDIMTIFHSLTLNRACDGCLPSGLLRPYLDMAFQLFQLLKDKDLALQFHVCQFQALQCDSMVRSAIPLHRTPEQFIFYQWSSPSLGPAYNTQDKNLCSKDQRLVKELTTMMNLVSSRTVHSRPSSSQLANVSSMSSKQQFITQLILSMSLQP